MTDLTPEVLAIHQWIRDDAPVSMKMTITPKLIAALADRIQVARAEGLRSAGEVGGVEPVAWMVTGDGCKFISYTAPTHEPVPGTIVTPLFAAPPSREA